MSTETNPAIRHNDAGATLADAVEYVRPNAVPLLFGVSRSRVWELIKSDEVESITIPSKPGARGMRLIVADSLRDWIQANAVRPIN